MSIFNPLSKAGYVLYCMGEAWFNERKYNYDKGHHDREASVVEQGLTRILENNEKLFASRITADQLDSKAFTQQKTTQGYFNRLGQTLLQNTQRVLYILNKQVFTPLIIQPFLTTIQNAQRLYGVMSRFAAMILQGASATAVDETLKEEETQRRKKDETGDTVQYADKFIRRSQASGQSSNT